MWGLWALVFLFQMMRGKSWTDLLVVVGVFSILLLTLTAFVPEWVIISLIIVAHLAWFGMAIIKRKKRLPPNITINK